MRPLILSFLILLAPISFLPAQEVCTNQIDDDGDGATDFADCDCQSKRGNVWHFGPGFSVDFNGSTPQVLSGSPLESFEGSASICDEDGNLLFFTNGGGRPTLNPDFPLPPGTIWDQNGDVMYDMMGEEGGGYSSQQSSVIVPKPGASSNYYLFTMDELENSENRGFRYFEIDMTGNGGLGEVVVADQSLFEPTYESLAAVQHENGEDYWIIIVDPQSPQRKFLVYAATASGVSFSADYTFNVGNLDLFPSMIKGSPTGDRINQRTTTEIIFFDFDKATGEISNPTLLPTASFGFGDFSPSGRYYYFEEGDFPLTNQRRISRIDLSDLSPNSPFEVIDSVSLMDPNDVIRWQLGPNGQVYFFASRGSSLGAVLCPDSETPTVDPEYLSLISTPGASFVNNSYGLPNFPNNFFYRPVLPLTLSGETFYEICGTDSVTLSIQTNQCADLLWSTGETTNSITVGEAGIYTITATVGCETQTLEIEVVDLAGGPILLDGPTAVCTGSAVSITASLDDVLAWTWLDTDGNIITDDQTVSFVNLSQDTVLIVQAELACGVAEQQVAIQAVSFPAAELEVNDLDCNNPTGSAAISNSEPTWIASWSDVGGTVLSNELSVDNLVPGDYQVEVSNVIGDLACSSVVEFTVEQTADFTTVELEVTDNPCPGDALGQIAITDLDGTAPYTYLWTDGTTGEVIGTGPVLENLPGGPYNLSVTDVLGCTVEVAATVNSPSLPEIQIDTDPALCGEANGSIFVSVSDPVSFDILLDEEEVEPSDLFGIPAGSYSLEIRSADGCIWLDSLLTVEDIRPFEFSADTTLFAFRGQPLQILLDLPVGNNFQYQWSPATDLSCADCASPFAIVEGDTNFTLFIEETNSGCRGTYTVEIRTRPVENVYIPNVFSPDNDGINDFFEVFPSDPGVQLTRMLIFDRWGGLIFESTAADARWDGTLNGQPLQTGVYVYMVEIRNSTGIDRRSGDVMLIE